MIVSRPGGPQRFNLRTGYAWGAGPSPWGTEFVRPPHPGEIEAIQEASRRSRAVYWAASQLDQATALLRQRPKQGDAALPLEEIEALARHVEAWVKRNTPEAQPTQEPPHG